MERSSKTHTQPSGALPRPKTITKFYLVNTNQLHENFHIRTRRRQFAYLYLLRGSPRLCVSVPDGRDRGRSLRDAELHGVCEADFYGELKVQQYFTLKNKFVISAATAPLCSHEPPNQPCPGKFQLASYGTLDASQYVDGAVPNTPALLVQDTIVLKPKSVITLPDPFANVAFTLMQASSTIAFPPSVVTDLAEHGWTFVNNAPSPTNAPVVGGVSTPHLYNVAKTDFLPAAVYAVDCNANVGASSTCPIFDAGASAGSVMCNSNSHCGTCNAWTGECSSCSGTWCLNTSGGCGAPTAAAGGTACLKCSGGSACVACLGTYCLNTSGTCGSPPPRVAHQRRHVQPERVRLPQRSSPARRVHHVHERWRHRLRELCQRVSPQRQHLQREHVLLPQRPSRDPRVRHVHERWRHRLRNM